MGHGTTRALTLHPRRATTPHHAMTQHPQHPALPQQATLASSHTPSHAHGGGARSLVPSRVTAQRQLQRATRAVKRRGGHPPPPAGKGGCSTAALSRTSSILSMVGARRGVDGAGAWRGGRPCDCLGVGRSGVLLWAGALGVLVGGARGWAVGPCAAARLLHPRARQCPPASLPRAGRHRHPDPLSTLPRRLARLTEKNGGASHLHQNGSRGGRTAPGGFVAPRKSCLPAAICTNGQWAGHTLQTVARFYHR